MKRSLWYYTKKAAYWAIVLVGLYVGYLSGSYIYNNNTEPSELVNYENEEIGIQISATKLRGFTLKNKSSKERLIKIKYGLLESGCNHCKVNTKHSLMLVVDAKSSFHKPMKKLGAVYRVELCTKHMVEHRQVTICRDLLKDEEMD